MGSKGSLSYKLIFLVLVLALMVPMLAACDEGEKTSTPTTSTTATPQNGPAVDLKKVKMLDTKTEAIGASGGIVRLNDEITVVVPSGTVDAAAEMTISKLDLDHLAAVTHSKPAKGFGELASYEVNIGSQHEFKPPLTIQIAYDPAQITSDYAPEKALLAAWWDTEQNIWRMVPVQVDSQRNVATITTDHLTIWKLLWIVRGYKIQETDHFILVYDPKGAISVGVEQDMPAIGKQPAGTRMVQMPQDVADFSQRVGIYLEQAYRSYMSLGYHDPRLGLTHIIEAVSVPTKTIPGVGIPVLALPESKIFVLIGQNKSESETGTLTGTITLADNFADMDQVKHETAHELFHAVEQMYFTVWGYGARQWWLEACADYAAAKIAWGGDLNTLDKVRLSYFGIPLNTVDTVHEYTTAQFIDYLVQRGVDFKGLFEAVAGGYTQILGSFNDYVNKKTGASLLQNYEAWMAYVLLDSSGPLEALTTSLLTSSIIEGPTDFPNSSSPAPISHTFNLKANYTAKVWAFKAVSADPQAPRGLKVEATGTVPATASVEATVYVVKDGQRPQAGVLPKGAINASTKSLNFSVAADETVYILAANASSSNQSLSVKVSDAVEPVAATSVDSVYKSSIRKVDYISGESGPAQNVVVRYHIEWSEPAATLIPGQPFNINLQVDQLENTMPNEVLIIGEMRSSAGVFVTAGLEWIEGYLASTAKPHAGSSQSDRFDAISPQLFLSEEAVAGYVIKQDASGSSGSWQKSASKTFTAPVPDKIPDKDTFNTPAKNIKGEEMLVIIYASALNGMVNADTNYLYEDVPQSGGAHAWQLVRKWQTGNRQWADPDGQTTMELR